MTERAAVYVITRQDDDPYVQGGVPRVAYSDLQRAWDTVAEFVAWEASDYWSSDLWRSKNLHVTRDTVTGVVANLYGIYRVELDR